MGPGVDVESVGAQGKFDGPRGAELTSSTPKVVYRPDRMTSQLFREGGRRGHGVPVFVSYKSGILKCLRQDIERQWWKG